jgi:DNA-binding response OmpR family regulator
LEALSRTKSEHPDVLISDVAMPEVSEIKLALLVQKLCPSCKVLLVSGHASTADLLLVAEKEGYDFELLSKPVHPSELLCRVRALVSSPA